MKLHLPTRLRKRPAAAPAEPPPATASLSTDAQQLLRRLEWTVIKRLDGRLQGDVRTYLRGGGVDLADLREYQPHDDVRRIDWNVTARLQTPHVRDYHEDRDMTVCFLVDASPSVGFGSAERSKQGLAQELVAVLARLFTRAGHRVGAVIHHGGAARDTVLPARGGRDAVLQLILALQASPPVASAAQPMPGLTELTRLLQAGERLLKRRSAVFVVSDFISTPGWETLLGRLTLRHDVLAVRVVDPWERELPDLGLVTLRDAETGLNLLVDLHDPGFRQRFAQLTAARDEALRSALSRARVDTLELATDEDLLAVLQRYTQLRRLRQRRSAAPAGLQRENRA
ncbi:MAG: DUF58 domain-containing protein [Burkholderiales bacterium]